MKSLKQTINEKLIISNTTFKRKYNYFPKTRNELIDILNKLIEERGSEGDFNDIDVSKITNMTDLFNNLDYTKYREQFNGNISYWDVSNVNKMEGMFYRCTSFNKDISSWDTHNVKTMEDMFMNCKSFNQPLNDWDVSNVENMSGMFYNCYEFNQPLNEWNISNTMIFDEMFSNCSSFNQDLSNWNINNTYTAYNMFSYCPIEYKNKPKIY